MDEDEAGSLSADLLGPATAADASPSERPERPRRVRVRTIVLAVVLVVLAGVAVGFGPTAWHVLRERNARIDRPDHVAGLTLDQSQNAKDTVDYLRTAVSADVPLDTTVGAVYVEGEDTAHSVIFFGGTGLLLSPEKQLGHAFGLVTDQTGGVDGVRREPAGPLGGVLKCGVTKTDDGPRTVCGWAGYGSLAVGLFPGRAVDESARLLRRMREAMQHRG